jgi:ABC-type multidrug transport system fused ATPase/permease subunit
MTTTPLAKPSARRADDRPASSAPPEEATSFWRFLWPMIRPYRWLAATAIVLNAMHGVAITFQTLMPKYLIDDVILASSLTMSQRIHRLAWLIVAYLFASLIARMLVWHIGYRIFTYVREKIVFALRANFFRHVNHLCLRFHIQHHSGELLSYLFGTPLAQVQTYFQQFTFGAPGALFLMLSTIIWLGAWDWLMSGVLLLMVAATAFLMHTTRLRMQRLYMEFQKTETSVTGYVADLLRGSRDVKLYAMEERVAADFQERVWEVGKQSYQRDVAGHVEWMKQEAIGYFAFAILCAAAVWRYFYDRSHKPPDRQITIGEIQAYLTSFVSLQNALIQLFTLSTLKGAAEAGVTRISAVLRTDSTTPDPIGFEAVVPQRGDIVFYNVTFGYETAAPVLRDVNLSIPYGQRVALVGPSGAGKSTITQLLLRLYDPDQGTILIGGLNIRHCRGPDLRQRFGVVPQDPFIFRASIRENLCVSRPGATDEEIRHACELANAWEFIAKLPEQLDTSVGEGGCTLSGGQRQRLAIARALLGNPDFLIFDEATSALDTVSEGLVRDALTRSLDHRTTLIIAHRLATVKDCERILVVDDGRIVQDGTYDALAAQPGVFRDLVQGQVLRG